MNTERLFELFVKRSTRKTKEGTVVTNSDFKKEFGDISVEDAWKNHELPRLIAIDAMRNRYEALRKFFYLEKMQGRATMQQSNVSESEYYKWNGWEFRFSGHRHPTGSMTNDLLHIIDMTDEGAAERVINEFGIKL